MKHNQRCYKMPSNLISPFQQEGEKESQLFPSRKEDIWVK